jgi:hypothetical protein
VVVADAQGRRLVCAMPRSPRLRAPSVRDMTSERSQAYGRVAQTLADLGPTKLLADEQQRVREAADTLLFCDDAQDETAAAALADVRALVEHLTDTGRWSEERAAQLADDVTACGPVTPVA